jgi:magnesium transporter
MIRSLALKELNLDDWWRVLRRELATGATLGAFLGLLGFIRIIVWHHAGWSDFRGHPYALGITVWVSVIGVVMFGSVVGSMLPFILRRFGLDPAASSAPFVATLVDVTGLVIYFTVAVILLSDTLLARPPAATMPAR